MLHGTVLVCLNPDKRKICPFCNSVYPSCRQESQLWDPKALFQGKQESKGQVYKTGRGSYNRDSEKYPTNFRETLEAGQLKEGREIVSAVEKEESATLR